MSSLLSATTFSDLVNHFNRRYADQTPLQLVGTTAGVTLALAFIYKQLTSKVTCYYDKWNDLSHSYSQNKFIFRKQGIYTLLLHNI